MNTDYENGMVDGYNVALQLVIDRLEQKLYILLSDTYVAPEIPMCVSDCIYIVKDLMNA